jgi:hypothetical protein
MIIKNPGDHPDYKVELEPHLDLGWGAGLYGSTGFGAGARATIPIVQNGFIPNLNNSIGISFGLDYLHYSGCYGSAGIVGNNGNFGCNGASYFVLPIVMQWNFWLTPRWSVFGEPGLYVYHASFDSYCNDPRFKNVACSEPTTTSVSFAGYVGGRLHFNDTVALTLRVGYPTVSLGVSFLL